LALQSPVTIVFCVFELITLRPVLLLRGPLVEVMREMDLLPCVEASVCLKGPSLYSLSGECDLSAKRRLNRGCDATL